MRAATGLLAVLLMVSCASLGQTATVQQAALGQTAAGKATGPVQPAAPVAEPVQVQAAGSAASTEAAGASAGGVAAVPFAAGAKVFLEPMGGFEEFLAGAIVKKKVPVVLVKERAKADFVVSGEARVRKRGFFTGFVLDTHGGGEISVKDARTDKQVFGCRFHRVDQGEGDFYVYQTWAGGCANHLKKALKKR